MKCWRSGSGSLILLVLGFAGSIVACVSARVLCICMRHFLRLSNAFLVFEMKTLSFCWEKERIEDNEYLKTAPCGAESESYVNNNSRCKRHSSRQGNQSNFVIGSSSNHTKEDR
jgi:hypothetical protein